MGGGGKLVKRSVRRSAWSSLSLELSDKQQASSQANCKVRMGRDFDIVVKLFNKKAATLQVVVFGTIKWMQCCDVSSNTLSLLLMILPSLSVFLLKDNHF